MRLLRKLFDGYSTMSEDAFLALNPSYLASDDRSILEAWVIDSQASIRLVFFSFIRALRGFQALQGGRRYRIVSNWNIDALARAVLCATNISMTASPPGRDASLTSIMVIV